MAPSPATPVILASFTTAGSLSPSGGLAIDSAGNLFGATQFVGSGGNGTIFEIANTPSGYAAPSTVATFSNSDHPRGVLTLDAAGNLFGALNGGTVFEVANNGGTLASTITTLGSFTGTNVDNWLSTEPAISLAPPMQGWRQRQGVGFRNRQQHQRGRSRPRPRSASPSMAPPMDFRRRPVCSQTRPATCSAPQAPAAPTR